MEFRFENWQQHWSEVNGENLAVTAALTELTCPDDESWNEVCSVITPALADALQEHAQMIASDPKQLMMGMVDNYFHVAVAAHLSDIDKSTPALAWAAFNKHMYAGFRDELAVIRYLIWSGFDVDASDGAGSALNYLVATKHGTGTMPRGVSLLLNSGADPNARRANGDTPLIGVSAFNVWSEDKGAVFRMLLEAGADPTLAADDGSTPMQFLVQFNQQNPHPDRTELIKALQ